MNSLMGWRWMEALWRDVAYAVRFFARKPGFALGAVASLAIGIGCSTAVFSVVDRILFRSLPYSHADRLVSVGMVEPLIAANDWMFAGTYQQWRASATPFDAMTSWIRVQDCDWMSDAPVRLNCGYVEATFLPVLGIAPQLGRNFSAEEDHDGGPNAALISYALWQSRFNGDPGVIGRRVALDGTPVTIVGVLPASFELPTLAPVDVLRPQRLREGSQRQRLVRVIARLRDGVSAEAAASALGPLYADFMSSVPEDFRKATLMRLRVEPLQQQQTREYRVAAWTLFGAVFAVLLIACANVAHLLAAQGASRRREAAIRSAIGATQARLLAQRLTEAWTLGVAGGVAGYGLAWLLLRIVVLTSPEAFLRVRQASLDWRVFAFCVGASVFSGLVVGAASSWKMPATGRRKTLQPALIAGQVAAALVLLTWAGLMLATVANLQNASLGLRPERVLTASFTLSASRYNSDERQIAFFDQLERELEGIPGVTAAGITDTLPPGGDPRSRPFLSMIGGGDRSQPGLGDLVKWRYVTPGYFAALGIPIVRGRNFLEEDRQGDVEAVVMNEALATLLSPRVDPVGKMFGSLRVVGVAKNVRNDGFSPDVQPEYYAVRTHRVSAPFGNQRPPYGWRRAIVVVRSAADVTEMIRTQMSRLDPTLPVEFGTLTQHLSTFVEKPRFTGGVLSGFALTGVLLAAVGLYALVSFAVAERTREIGIRMALGARSSAVVGMVLRQAMTPALAGAALGVALSFWLSSYLRTLLFGIPSGDTRVLAAAIAVLIVVSFVASVIPARHAARVDPNVALRHD